MYPLHTIHEQWTSATTKLGTPICAGYAQSPVYPNFPLCVLLMTLIGVCKGQGMEAPYVLVGHYLFDPYQGVEIYIPFQPQKQCSLDNIANSSQWQVGGLSAETRQTPLWTKQILDVNKWGKPPRSICATPGYVFLCGHPHDTEKRLARACPCLENIWH